MPAICSPLIPRNELALLGAATCFCGGRFDQAKRLAQLAVALALVSFLFPQAVAFESYFPERRLTGITAKLLAKRLKLALNELLSVCAQVNMLILRSTI